MRSNAGFDVSKMMYRIRTGEKLHLDDPKTFNEKIQWLKIMTESQFIQRWLINMLSKNT